MNDPGQWHLYAYCANNPINYVDPSGHAHILTLSSGMYFAVNTTVSIGAVLTVSTGVVIVVAAVMGGIYLGGKQFS